MKVTKYPQSCLLIEDHGKRLLIDPGNLVPGKYQANDLKPIDGILITHEHADHVDPKFIKDLLGDSQVPVISNQSTKKAFGDIVNKVVNDNEKFEVVGYKVTARELPHSPLPDGSEGPQNTGYVIDDSFFHAGDGIIIDGLSVASAAIPIAGPDISPRDVLDFIKSLGCKNVIPIHYEYFIADPKFFGQLISSYIPGTNYILINNGETAEILTG